MQYKKKEMKLIIHFFFTFLFNLDFCLAQVFFLTNPLEQALSIFAITFLSSLLAVSESLFLIAFFHISL